MLKGEKKEVEDINFIVRVTGKTSKTITIPDTVCEFSNIDFGDVLNLKVKSIKKGGKK